MTWGSNGTAEGQFKYPGAIALDASGNIYVSDNLNYRIQKFDRNGNFLRMWGWGVSTGVELFEICTSNCKPGKVGGGNGQFTTVSGMAFDAAGNLHIVDLSQDQVQKFDSNGNFLARWGAFGSAEGFFDGASGAAIDSTGKLYIADNYIHRLQKFNLAGTFERMWGYGVANGIAELQACTSGCQAGIGGSGIWQFQWPSAVAVDSSDNVYVVDQGNDRVLKFTGLGNPLDKIGGPGSLAGQLDRPSGVWVDPAGNVYVSDTDNNRIQKFDSGGTFVSTFGWGVGDGSAEFQVCTAWCQQGIAGSGYGQFDGPTGLAGDSRNLYVVDSQNHRIQNLGPALGIFVGDAVGPDGGRGRPDRGGLANVPRAQLTGTGR
jgi:DNA-binding beta-propeller fold protein YncE